jgi:hypothetical protein
MQQEIALHHANALLQPTGSAALNAHLTKRLLQHNSLDHETCLTLLQKTDVNSTLTSASLESTSSDLADRRQRPLMTMPTTASTSTILIAAAPAEQARRASKGCSTAARRGPAALTDSVKG